MVNNYLVLRLRWITLFFTLVLNVPSIGADTDSMFFKAGDRVCFVGDSITNNGGYFHNLQLYYVTRFPDSAIRLINCGVSGDVTRGILRRMKDDILIHEPTHAVIMIGMNDVRRALYAEDVAVTPEILSDREQAIEAYKANLEEIVQVFLAENIPVILQTPSIYDETAVTEIPSNKGVHDALKACADIVVLLADKYNLPVIGFFEIMHSINQEVQKLDPAASIVGKDRVHPGPAGHLVMAYQFLKAEEAPRYVSKVRLSRESEETVADCVRSEVDEVNLHSGGATFALRSESLPFPVAANQRAALGWVPFMRGLNVELLEVNGLSPGHYQLIIDGVSIGSFSHTALAEGINLAEFEATPQFQQALKVRDALEQLWEAESSLRNIRQIEFNSHFRNLTDKEDLPAVQARLTDVFIENYPHNSAYHIGQLNKYIKNKPIEEELQSSLEILLKEAYMQARPKWHQYEIISLPVRPASSAER